MKYFAPLSILTALLCSVYSTSASSSNILIQEPSKDNSEECTCYLTSGPSESYFQHHRFWDFRSIPADGSNNCNLAPPSLDNVEDLMNAPPTSTYLSTSDFVNNWSIQNWKTEPDSPSPISRVNSAQNVYISRSTDPDASTFLTLRASRLEDFMSIAELDSNQKNLFHSSIRARMRIIPIDSSSSPAPGAVAGLFTYYSSTAESDIEILTRDPTNQIRYSNQPDYDARDDSAVPGASTKSTLPASKQYTDWLDYRIDWFDGISRWYVDGEMVLEKTLNVPKEPSGLVLNLWGDGGEWSGNMTVGDEVILGVQWIEMVFNTSGTVDGPPPPKESDDVKGPGGKDAKKRSWLWKREKGGEEKCKVACNIDGVREVGYPETAFNATTSGAAASFLTSGPFRISGEVVAMIAVMLATVLATALL